MRFRTVIITTALIVLAAPAAAQEPVAPGPRWRVTLAPRFGVFLPDKGMGRVEEDGVGLTMTSSPTAGLDVELRTPAPWLSFRAIAETSVGSRLTEEAAGDADDACTSGCADEGGASPVGESSVVTLVGDAVVRPWGTARRFQPFAFAGAGVKRYDLTHGNRLLDGGQESAFTFHFGGGLDVPVGPIALSFEAADYISLLQGAARSADGSLFIEEPSPGGSGTLKHDFFLTLGIRLFPH